MKKNRIFTAVAITAAAMLLASCTISVQPAPKPVRNYNFASNWKEASTNRPVACDNQQTVFEYSFYAENPAMVQSITEHYKGEVTEQTKTTTVPNSAWSINGNTITVQAVFNAGGDFLPLSTDGELDSQAIVVTPVVPADERGATHFHVEVGYGGTAIFNYDLPTTRVPVYANCTPTSS